MLLIVILGLAIRLLIAWFGLSPLDTDSVYQVFQEIQKGNGIYNDQWLYYNNPPLWGWLIWILGVIAQKTGIWLSFWSKIPFIIADLGIFLILLEYDSTLPFRKRIFYASLYFLNPLAIVVSAYHGQLESLFLLPLLISVKVLGGEVSRRKVFFSGLWWGLASCIKIIPLITLPAYLVYLWRESAKKNGLSRFINIFLFGIGALFPLILIFLPFLDKLAYVLVRILSYEPPFWGFWGIWGMKKIIELLSPLSLAGLGNSYLILLFTSIFINIFILLVKKFSLPVGVVISFLFVYLLASSFSPHYLLWIVPFLIVALILKDFSKIMLLLFYSLAAFCLEFTWLMVVLAEKNMTLDRWKIITQNHEVFIPDFANRLSELINLPIFLTINLIAWLCCFVILLSLIRKSLVSR